MVSCTVSVSYTHLDVYKRQALGRLLYPVELTPRFEAMYREYVKEHWNAAGRLLIEADSPQKGRRASLEPGRLPWLVTEILERAGDGEESGPAEEGKNQLTDRIEALIALAREAEAVSYTHLDVYKRQGQPLPQLFPV